MEKAHKPTDRALLVLTAIIVLVIIAMMSLWAIDISVSALLVGQATEQPLFLTNGFWKTNPTQLYHGGLWLLTICMILLAILSAYLTLVVFRKKIQEELSAK